MTNKIRCQWSASNELFFDYHDQEWGVPLYDDTKLFEFLILEGAQAGLSWATILQRRPAYKQAFANFDPKKVAGFTDTHVKTLLGNPGIIRNKLKVASAVNNAQRFLEIQKEFGSFSTYQWQFVGGTPKQNHWHGNSHVPATSPEAEAFSKDLKRRGFTFVGPTIIYAHMQAVGMVNDHTVECFRYHAVQKMAK